MQSPSPYWDASRLPAASPGDPPQTRTFSRSKSHTLGDPVGSVRQEQAANSTQQQKSALRPKQRVFRLKQWLGFVTKPNSRILSHLALESKVLAMLM
jgi:hypothetical protein